MKIHTLIILSVLFTMGLVSCEEELVMVPEQETKVSPRVVLIEELTGVSCPNCPSGTAQLKQLKEQYDENLIVVAIHGSFLAFPTAESKYDFRSGKAAALEAYLRPWDGKPAASVNRVQYTDELSVSTPSLWSNYIDQELDKEHELNIFLENTYDEVSREVSIAAKITGLKDFSEDDNLRISVMVLQSEIEDAQEDMTTIIEEYEHNHVMRDVISDVTGDPIGSLTADEEKVVNYTYTIPDNATIGEKEAPYDPIHMSIVAFVHKVNGDIKDVLQAAEQYIVE